MEDSTKTEGISTGLNSVKDSRLSVLHIPDPYLIDQIFPVFHTYLYQLDSFLWS